MYIHTMHILQNKITEIFYIMQKIVQDTICTKVLSITAEFDSYF